MADDKTAQAQVQSAAAQAVANAAPAAPATEPVAAPPTDPAPSFDREHPAFRAVTKQVEEERQARAALQAQLDEILDKEKKAQEEAERKSLEEKGQYDQIIKQKEAEIAAMKEAQKAQMLASSLQIALLAEGVTNDLFIKGAVASYTGDEKGIAEFVAGLKSDPKNAPAFGIVQEQPRQGLPPANSGAPASSAAVNWQTIKADLRDPAKADAAAAALKKYALDNDGALPPGFQ